jgi:hypothetical protein
VADLTFVGKEFVGAQQGLIVEGVFPTIPVDLMKRLSQIKAQLINKSPKMKHKVAVIGSGNWCLFCPLPSLLSLPSFYSLPKFSSLGSFRLWVVADVVWDQGHCCSQDYCGKHQ